MCVDCVLASSRIAQVDPGDEPLPEVVLSQTLVEPPRVVNVIGTKWVLKNDQGEDGEIVRNKACLVGPGFSQVEGLDFGETFAPVAQLEAIRILLAFAVFKGFKLYQMDMNSALLNGVIQEEVYVRQPLGFESPKYPDRVYKLSKALYGLKQAPRAWYAKLKTFLLAHGYVMGSVDKTLFTLNHGTDFLLVQIDVDDIIFGGSSHTLVSRFQEMMESELQMSMMGEPTFFRYPSEANEARYLHASSEVHEGPNEEVQHGGAEAYVYSDEHHYITWSR
jgi:hypothetical protein